MAFEDAIAVFKDEMLVEIFDEDNSDTREDRYKAVGMVGGFLIAAVIHTERGARQRIISARKATKLEKRLYYEQH